MKMKKIKGKVGEVFYASRALTTDELRAHWSGRAIPGIKKIKHTLGGGMKDTAGFLFLVWFCMADPHQ